MRCWGENFSKSDGRRVRRRDEEEVLRKRVGLLSGTDRAMMGMYLKGVKFRDMAKLLGVSEATAGRRVRKLCRQLTNGEYVVCLQNRRLFSKGELEVARWYYLEGQAVRAIAEMREESYYGVRRVLERVRGILELIEAKNNANLKS